MKEAWFLIFLSFPIGNDGLIMGWQKEYSSRSGCEIAKIEVIRQSRRLYASASQPQVSCVRKT